MKVSWLVVLLCCGTFGALGCTSEEVSVVDESGMTPEQQAAQQAYVEEMDGPPPTE
ncbi:hypothetical protein [Rhodopirellula islandica]|uniref:hypothetical protein n=1 Tax=Rhodopirellula islandica TaxID=595434 RepID=UPI001364D1D7|nr:hypothetical protein [Rhodopirellula islandica]